MLLKEAVLDLVHGRLQLRVQVLLRVALLSNLFQQPGQEVDPDIGLAVLKQEAPGLQVLQHLAPDPA
jgi:hypothetical protein